MVPSITPFSIDSSQLHVQVARSPDLVTWSYLGEALPVMPAWWVGPNTWAPDVSLHNGTYYMYYGGSGSATGMCIGVALSQTPEGPFVDVGVPIMCGTDDGDIDPKAIDDPVSGIPFLFWGSDFHPLSVQQLAPNRTALAPGSAPMPLLFPNTSAPYSSLIEGTWIAPRPGTQGGFHFFYSGNNCCGPTAHYAVMVARSDSLLGPYVTLGEATSNDTSVILSLNAAFNAPGHNSVITDDDGVDWMFYHAYQGAELDARMLMLDRIDYTVLEDGWPYVGTPSSTPQVAPAVSARPQQHHAE